MDLFYNIAIFIYKIQYKMDLFLNDLDILHYVSSCYSRLSSLRSLGNLSGTRYRERCWADSAAVTTNYTVWKGGEGTVGTV